MNADEECNAALDKRGALQTLTEKVPRFYQKQNNEKAVHPELGEAKLNLEGMKDSHVIKHFVKKSRI